MFGINWQQDLTPMDQDITNNWSPLHENINDTDIDPEEFIETRMTQKQCLTMYESKTESMKKSSPEGFCEAISDRLSCFPPTPLNQTATTPCFAELLGIKYDDTQNATRECLFNGSWDKTNYAACKEIMIYTHDVDTQTTIYCAGYSVSLITLVIAMGIFTHFKELRCLRNTIHMNLMWSYILTYVMWILTLIMLTQNTSLVLCTSVITLLNYFNITTFFWMFVEGLYLYILVVKTLTRENYKLRVYVCIGWGLPLLVIMVWAVAKGLTLISSPSASTNACVVFDKNDTDWIHQAPTVIVLVLNIGFLFSIMWVLITKLRSANTVETQQYRKAAKALLVLMPLLGITYVITIYAPTENTTSTNVFESIRAVLLSTQGFTVALFYCFLNTEVQNTIRHHFETWRTNRSLGPSRLRSGSRSRDWSPRSRTESLRLYSQPTNLYHKRESCTSEVTTTTLVTVNGGTTRPSNGGGPQVRSPFLHPPRPSYGGNV